MDKALLDFEVSIDADCKLLTVGKPFAIEGTKVDSRTLAPAVIKRLLQTRPRLSSGCQSASGAASAK